jgi:hypothetical protein
MSKLHTAVYELLGVGIEYILPSRSSSDDAEVITFLVQSMFVYWREMDD